CAFACNPGYMNCDSKDANACETDVNTDESNCGGCGEKCIAVRAAQAECKAGVCTLACVSLYGDCNSDGSDGCEHDLSSDTKNCGYCGRDCLSGTTCQAGYCVPRDMGGPGEEVVDFEVAADKVFTVTGSGVYHTSQIRHAWLTQTLASGAATQLAVSNGTPTTAYFNTMNSWTETGSVWRIPTIDSTPGTPVQHGTAPFGVFFGLITSGSSLYYSVHTPTGNEIRRMSISTGNDYGFTTTSNVATSLAVGGGYLYSVQGDKVIRIPTSGGSPATVAGTQTGPVEVAADSTDACWIGDNAVRCRAHDATSPLQTRTINSNSSHRPQGIATTAGSFYWSESEGSVYRWTKSDNTKVKLVSEGTGSNPTLVRVSGSYVYWLNKTHNRIYRVAR
ncbi:MAG: hypothetical protein MUF54_18635, partial [Polyangiaceae bacterium]|nr:hypothetical protein [Polyangiaceae bacterium]